jgi:hypothetical protein
MVKQYYKVNVNNEPPVIWVNVDLNEDEIIEENEGRFAWY